MRSRALPILVAVLLVAAVGVGLSQAGAGGRTEAPAPFDLAAAKRQLAGAPRPLAALHRDANRLIPATPRSFAARLRALRGHPVVVNKWASWCGPCQVEFPAFQQQATKRGREVAFVGLDSQDTADTARTFLRDTPTPYPHYVDPKGRIAEELAPVSFPTTVFLDERGRTAYVHQGQYRDEADLAADIDRYLAP